MRNADDRRAARTLTELMGFRDRDFTTPEHDAILLWLLDHLDEVVAEVAAPLRRWTSTDRPVPPELAGMSVPVACPGPGRVELERPIVVHNDRLIGFVDLSTLVDRVVAVGAHGKWVLERRCDRWSFEVKSTIPSFGETLRQIRMYQTFEKARYVVVSPDDRLRERFEAQGVRFVTAPAARPRPKQTELFG